MAKDSQRGSSADDDRELPGESINDDVDASDDDLLDELEDDESDDDSDSAPGGSDNEPDADDAEVGAPVAKRGKQPKTAATTTKKKAAREPKASRGSKSTVAGAAPGTFLQQVVNELSKVVWPTRKQMVTYTTVVLVFVVILVASVWGFDLGVGKVMDWIFA